jgi:hypothetical protein
VFDGSAWKLGMNWSGSPTFAWTPGTPNASYSVGVWVRSATSTADNADRPQSTGSVKFGITAPTLTLQSLLPDKPAPQQPGTTITFTAVTTGGIAPLQYRWWIFDGTTWSPAGGWTASNTFAWTPVAFNAAYRIGVWVKSAPNPNDSADHPGATGSAAYAISPSSAQVRFHNDLVLCDPGCRSITARLAASQGYVWFSTSGVTSAYQPVFVSYLGYFTATILENGQIISFPGGFAVSAGRRYALVLTVDGAGSLLLVLYDEGTIMSGDSAATASQAPLVGQTEARSRLAPLRSPPLVR